jgi:hypothetical protein
MPDVEAVVARHRSRRRVGLGADAWRATEYPEVLAAGVADDRP